MASLDHNVFNFESSFDFIFINHNKTIIPNYLTRGTAFRLIILYNPDQYSISWCLGHQAMDRLRIYMLHYIILSSSGKITKLATLTRTWYCWNQAIFPRWWHQMEAFSALLAACAENSPVTGKFSSQRASNADFDVSLMWVCISY